MDKEYFKKITSTGIILVLLVLAFFLLKPILLTIILAIILAFLVNPLYLRIKKLIKSSNLSAFIICILLAFLIITPVWFLTPILLNQSFQFYLGVQQIDFITPLTHFFPNLFASETFSQEVGSTISSFVSKLTNSIVNLIADLIRNFPRLFLQLLILFFTFFFVLKDKNKIINYVRSILPFSKKIEEKLFKSSRGITVSIIYGQVVLGTLQGLLVGVGFFIFHVKNALFLTILAGLAGIFPIVGTTIIWVPVAIYLFAIGDIFSAIGIVLFGLIAAGLDNFVKPVFISRRIDLHPALLLIGMVGGMLLLGLVGVILGPLILAYLLIILEMYRDKRSKSIFRETIPIKGEYQK